MSVDAEWTDTFSAFPGALPMECGTWTVTLMEPAPARLLSRLIVD